MTTVVFNRNEDVALRQSALAMVVSLDLAPALCYKLMKALVRENSDQLLTFVDKLIDAKLEGSVEFFKKQ